jgi:hypothetical protein
VEPVLLVRVPRGLGLPPFRPPFMIDSRLAVLLAAKSNGSGRLSENRLTAEW